MVLNNAAKMLEATSRTFYIPIMRLPDELKSAVTSAYLCLRAIDEIEDHPTLDNQTKAHLLQSINLIFQGQTEGWLKQDPFEELFEDVHQLPEVSLRLHEWVVIAPPSIAPRIWDVTATMSARMAYWAAQNWKIDSQADLDAYTFSVAGAVGLLLSDLWAWHSNVNTNRIQAVGFGRGLQSVNILRNASEDAARGVCFYPTGWSKSRMLDYAKSNLQMAEDYTVALPAGGISDFCRIPLALAQATLATLERGEEKLRRQEVILIVQKIVGSAPAQKTSVSV